ncbi:MAG TPA: hypothetical protein VFV87_01640 [Pirellulaceae bacterium]|nr:hypothetical protein [Pirellulaceae bacterium]
MLTRPVLRIGRLPVGPRGQALRIPSIVTVVGFWTGMVSAVS